MFRFPQISSRENQKLKLVRAIRDGREDKFIFIEGLRLAEEIGKTDLNIKSVFFSSKFGENLRGIQLLNQFAENIEIFEIENGVFDSLSDTKTSQGIILIAERPINSLTKFENELSENPLVILLHQVNNPANAGAILRTAEAAGATGVITTKGTTDIFSTKTNRSALGANFRLPFWTNAEFSEVISFAKLKGIKTVCADIRSKLSYLEVDWRAPRLLIVGSEGHGLNESERSATDESLIIPMENGVESLNVAVACGVILFEAKRQRNL